MDMTARGMHRIIRIRVHPDIARAVVIDDFHHFRISISHDSHAVTGIRTEAVRYPYSLCPSAGEALRQLIGLPLTRRVFDVSAAIDARMQCTHQFDVAALLITAAARGQPRDYHILVTDPREGRCSARLMRNDGFQMDWIIANGTVLAPADCAGVDLDKGFTAWAAGMPDEDMAEGALALRRAHMIMRGRINLDELNQRSTALARSSCYVMQPERASSALRIPTVLRNDDAPPTLDAGDLAWLAAQ